MVVRSAGAEGSNRSLLPDRFIGAAHATAAALGWALGRYRFTQYKSTVPKGGAVLVWPKHADRQQAERLYRGTAIARDLVNMPADDQGPAELANAGRRIFEAHGGKCKVIKGNALIKSNYPTLHRVGRAATAARAPQLVDLTWGKARAPKVTLVGKGIVFDSGGLDIKPAPAMRLMKKDMGGAASVLGLAHMIMDAKLPVRLRVLLAAAENAVSADAMRPGDVITTRKGITVEVGNTDAEGRLVLCDALFEACREKPDLLIDMATLTGAARIALGTEVPALFCTADKTAAAIDSASDKQDPDPLWRLPLYSPYRRHLESYIADICNIDNVGRGGAITAALFLKEFVGADIDWVHIDTMAWNLSYQAGRPKGGEAFGIRSLYRMLERRYR